MNKKCFISAYCSREGYELGFNPEDLPSFREIELLIEQDCSNERHDQIRYILKDAKLLEPVLPSNYNCLSEIFKISTKDGNISVEIPSGYRFGPISIVQTK